MLLNCQCGKTYQSLYFVPALFQNRRKWNWRNLIKVAAENGTLKEDCSQQVCFFWARENHYDLVFFLSLLLYTPAVTAASNRKEGRKHFRACLEAWFRAQRNSRLAHHHRNNQGETRKEQLRAIPGKKLGLISKCHIEVQLIQNGIWGKKTKAVRVNKLILWKIIMHTDTNFPSQYQTAITLWA